MPKTPKAPKATTPPGSWKIGDTIGADPYARNESRLVWIVDGEEGGNIGEVNTTCVRTGTPAEGIAKIVNRVKEMLRRLPDLTGDKRDDLRVDVEALVVNLAIVTEFNPHGVDSRGYYWEGKAPSGRAVVKKAQALLDALAGEVLGGLATLNPLTAVMIRPEDLENLGKMLLAAGVLRETLLALKIPLRLPDGTLREWTP